eukprot:263112-Hanusia_phi.AAC.1
MKEGQGRQIDGLLRWAQQQGCYISPKVQLGKRETEGAGNGERGMWALETIEEGEVLMRLVTSSSFRISSDLVRQSSSVAAGIRAVESSDGEFADDLLLTIFLASSRKQSDHSPFSQYVQSLPPEKPDLPIFWEAGDLRLLPRATVALVERMKEEFQDYMQKIRK